MSSVETEASASSPRSPAHRRHHLQFKTYIVLQRSYVRDRHRPNVKVIAVKLTQAAAQEVVDAVPGTWFERHYADKLSR